MALSNNRRHHQTLELWLPLLFFWVFQVAYIYGERLTRAPADAPRISRKSGYRLDYLGTRRVASSLQRDPVRYRFGLGSFSNLVYHLDYATMALSSNRERHRRLALWFPVLFFWLFQVALTSTASGSRVHQFRGESLEKSIVAWSVWALLAPLIVSIDRWLPLSRSAIFKRFLVHIPFSLLFTALNLYSDALITASLSSRLNKFPRPFDVVRESLAGQFQARFVVYWVVLFLYITLDYASHLNEREIRTAELERLVSEARLEVLRAKLHPHFLFNTLNTISAHVEREPRTARRMLEQLGEMLRLSLAHAEDQEIPLAQEIAFIEQYLDLQKARFEERLDAIVSIDPDVLHALVPTFILQPLIENVVRHGTVPSLEQILVRVKAWQGDGRLYLSVEDDGPGLPPGWDPDHSVGIGISNTRERLRYLYGDREQNFKISSGLGKGVRVDLSFPFRDSHDCHPNV